MSSKSDVSSTLRRQRNSRAITPSPTARTTGMELSSIDKAIASQLNTEQPAREYLNARFGPIIEGHYTEF
ncbi:MAG TPA: hypothetical protein VMR33_20865 [Candidatus Baltobacteraceae bacterium]|jgi:hypothetical protein|nr:hypothetical protein [Candidatus Baltobacteraceae bacterium]